MESQVDKDTEPPMPRLITALSLLLDYLLAPSVMWCASLLSGFEWLADSPPSIASRLGGGAAGMLVVVAMAYQIGFLGAYREGRKRYFYVVFVVPVFVGLLGLTIGLLQLA